MIEERKEISIHLYDDSSKGIMRIDYDNWSGTVIVCPRSHIRDLLSSDWKEKCGRHGIYLLLDDDDPPKIYIGESSNVQGRLRNHSYKLEEKIKDFYWTKAFIFTDMGKNFDKAKIKDLELLMIEKVRDAKRAMLMNVQNKKSDPTIESSRSELGPTERYLNHAQDILTVIGFPYMDSIRPSAEREKRDIPLEKPKTLRKKGSEEGTQSQDNLAEKPRRFHFHGRGFKGEGIYQGFGFVILEGSIGKKEQAQSLRPEWKDMRQSLIRKNKVIEKEQHIEFNEDVLFKSPSAAASILAGAMRNGLISWKDGAKRTIKQLEEKMLDVRFESAIDEKTTNKNKRAKKSAGSSKRPTGKSTPTLGTTGIRRLLDAGLMKAGDKIWLEVKGKPSSKATLTKNGLCRFRKELMSLNDYAKEVTGAKSINIYRSIIHGPTGDVVDKLRNQLK